MGARSVPSTSSSLHQQIQPTARPSRAGQFSLDEAVGCVLEIVIDGLDLEGVEEAMRLGVKAACKPGIVKITAGNYGKR